MRFDLCAALWGACWLLSACSPTLDWRTVPLDGPAAEVLLPCKPDRGTRKIMLADQEVDMSMVGCDAGGATFALAWTALPDTLLPGEVLTRWKEAVLVNMHATQPLAVLDERAFTLPGAQALPQSVRATVVGLRSEGKPVTAQLAWFARRSGNTTYVLHAMLYADKQDAVVADTFFSGIRLPSP